MKTMTQLARVSTIADITLTLNACGGLHDVHYKWCPPQQPAPQPPSTQETITLQADALFEFDRGDLAGMLRAGKATLDRLIDRVDSGYARIKRIVLEGHTDRLGPTAYNRILSTQRATTVMLYLQNHGVTAQMSAVGKGESKPGRQAAWAKSPPRSWSPACNRTAAWKLSSPGCVPSKRFDWPR